MPALVYPTRRVPEGRKMSTVVAIEVPNGFNRDDWTEFHDNYERYLENDASAPPISAILAASSESSYSMEQWPCVLLYTSIHDGKDHFFTSFAQFQAFFEHELSEPLTRPLKARQAAAFRQAMTAMCNCIQMGTYLLYIEAAEADQAEYYTALADLVSDGHIGLTTDRARTTILLADPPLVSSSLVDFSSLKWFQSTFAGIDSLTSAGMRRDYTLTNIKGIFGQLISEYVIGNLICHLRSFHQLKSQQQAGQWAPVPYRSLRGLVAVVLGTGSIGLELAQNLTHLGLEVHGANTTGMLPEPHCFRSVARLADLGPVLARAAVVVSTLPDTPATHDTLDTALFSQCSGAALFNVGRGTAVNDADLLTAIEQGHVAHAFLDVFRDEPLPQSHPFWACPGVTVTPHVAAVSFPSDVVSLFRENLRRYLTGEGLLNVVDFDKGY
ncbi:D-isomer specific 2-hydroxyacid dehydrogenase, NAD binding domain [Carpediemonas membranifera]|uniref:D-isomer specific 2-hydroxyacid dehydrogenase, NAD binding domain n=1 Tax=Carpediemonas membranifera TaxID=201153 RepID=A0A8J6E1G3_9EUKA|nr:D-isomer specific 2-hydroxyacid dehydrogenase, NAD binding domain [Carpediemonas membranifera]|eukprot:KAG9393026.1 D-isomer specific 2-hydroxyacid dehydrogenase, NAD binding domain [Carpediemonas membranifera]